MYDIIKKVLFIMDKSLSYENICTGDDMLKDEIKIMDIVDMLMRRWWIMLISMMIVGVMAFVFTEVFISPTYSSKGALYVNASKEQINQTVTTGTINASQQLVNTYAEILKRRTFLESVAEDIENRYSVNELQNMITISPVNETEIMEISVVCTDPEYAYLVAHSILMRAPDELMRVVEAGSVKLLDDAKRNNIAIAPNLRQNTLIGALLGIILGALIILLLEFVDTRIKNSESIVSKYEEPLLGEIPSLNEFKR